MNFIYVIFMGLLWRKKDSHVAANEAIKMDTFERTLDALESRLTSLSGRLSTMEDELGRLMHTVGNLEQCKDCVTSVEVKEQQPTCQVYEGSVCSTHIGNTSIYNTTRHDMGLKEERLIAALSVISNSMGLSDQCMKYLIPSVCHFAFPQCDRDTKSGVRRMCRDECEMLENDTCKNEYTLASRHQIAAPVLPRCDELPHVGTDCIRIGLPVKSSVDNKPALPVLPVLELLAQVMSPSSVRLTWIDATLNKTHTVTDARYYTIRYTSIPKQGKYFKVRAKTNVVIIDGLQADTTYEFSVRVTIDGLKSKWSTPVQNTTIKTSNTFAKAVNH